MRFRVKRVTVFLYKGIHCRAVIKHSILIKDPSHSIRTVNLNILKKIYQNQESYQK